MDPRIEKLADLMVNYSVAVKPHEKVLIRGSLIGEPLIKAIYAKVLQAGGYPLVVADVPGINEILYRYANDDQLAYIPEPYRMAMDTYDVAISILGDANTKALTNVDPARMALRSRSWAPVSKTMMERAAKGDLRWTLTLFPTDAHAQDAEMSLTEYEDFVYNACMPDMNDPVGYWQKIRVQQDRIVAWLKGKDQVHVKAEGTDLRLSVKDRTFINCCCHNNVPDGEVFTGPVEDSAEGYVTFTYPALYNGHEVTGVRLWFEKGRVVKATADKNEEFLLKMLDTDAGSRYLGEFAIGTNEGINRFTGEILFDEKIGGSFHMALGAGYPETGAKNESGIHWDMICDLRQGGEIRVDDELLYQNGKFVI
ncbi:MAG: aminopeptidase [Anaerolineaceae bacterium]